MAKQDEDYSLPPTIDKRLWERLNTISQENGVRRIHVLRRGIELFAQQQADRGSTGRGGCIVPGLGKVSDEEARRIASTVSRYFSKRWAARHKEQLRQAGVKGRLSRYGTANGTSHASQHSETSGLGH